jgi:DNA-binding LytR/AlgR family response regulator
LTQSSAQIEDPRAQGVRAAAWRIALMCLAIPLVMVLIDGRHDWENAAELFAECALGAVVGLSAARWVVPVSWHRRALAGSLLLAVVITLPVAGFVIALHVILHHQSANLAAVDDVTPSVFGVTLVMVGLAYLVRRAPTQTLVAAPDAPPPKFLERLPAKLKGAQIYAVEAEDHYLRLHTSLGQDLILLRLSDAIAELEGIEGAQTHRSWWVAREAVTGAERLDGRAVLTLRDGAEVPVSRGFARELRAAGWF